MKVLCALNNYCHYYHFRIPVKFTGILLFILPVTIFKILFRGIASIEYLLKQPVLPEAILRLEITIDFTGSYLLDINLRVKDREL